MFCCYYFVEKFKLKFTQKISFFSIFSSLKRIQKIIAAAGAEIPVEIILDVIQNQPVLWAPVAEMGANPFPVVIVDQSVSMGKAKK